MAAVVYPIRWSIPKAHNICILAVCVPTGAIVFIAVLWLLRAPELQELRGIKEEKIIA